jgi:hypothetical protein
LIPFHLAADPGESADKGRWMGQWCLPRGARALEAIAGDDVDVLIAAQPAIVSD